MKVRRVKPTKTQIVNAVWKETNLYRSVNGDVITVPFHSCRYTKMECPSPKFFKIKHSPKEMANSAETLTISGNGEFQRLFLKTGGGGLALQAVPLFLRSVLLTTLAQQSLWKM